MIAIFFSIFDLYKYILISDKQILWTICYHCYYWKIIFCLEHLCPYFIWNSCPVPAWVRMLFIGAPELSWDSDRDPRIDQDHCSDLDLKSDLDHILWSLCHDLDLYAMILILYRVILIFDTVILIISLHNLRPAFFLPLCLDFKFGVQGILEQVGKTGKANKTTEASEYRGDRLNVTWIIVQIA